MDNLSIVEKTRLDQCEAVISRGVKTFIEVGNALAEIRDSRLYRLNHGTFEEYCKEKWGMEKRHAYRMMDAAQVVENVSHGTQILPESERQARPLSSIEPAQQAQVWQQVIETAPEGKITAAHVQAVVNEYRGIEKKPDPIPMDDRKIIKPEIIHISDDSYEWYTPPEYIEAARRVMGSIDLDPASCEKANEVVKARVFYTKDDDGLTKSWSGNVWMNPPYNMPLIEQFTKLAIDSYFRKSIQAVILVNNATDTAWFHNLLQFPVCFTRGRVKFWNPAGPDLGARQGQAIFYLGDNNDQFCKAFSKFGAILRVYNPKP